MCGTDRFPKNHEAIRQGHAGHAEDFDPDETLKGLFPTKSPRQSAKDMQAMKDFDPNEILKGLFPTKSPQGEPHNFTNSEANKASTRETTIAEPESPPREQYNSSSDSSSDSEVDDALVEELDAMLAEPESPPREQYNSSSDSSSRLGGGRNISEGIRCDVSGTRGSCEEAN